jgi:hypothetical protein
MQDDGDFAEVIAALKRVEKSLEGLGQSTSSILELAKRLDSARKLSQPQTLALSEVPKLLQSYGHVSHEDTLAVNRAVAAMMRRILRDPKLVEIMHLTQQLRLLRPLNDVLIKDIGYGRMFEMEFWTQYTSKIKEKEDKVEELLKETKAQMSLLEFLAKNLKGYPEEMELPEVEPHYPPSRMLPADPSS